MLVTTAFCPNDAEQALRQARWLQELGGAAGHSLLLVADTACPAMQVGEIQAEYAKSYDTVELLPFVDHYRSWPRSPNDCFATAARHIMRTRPQPWFHCEPDCVFLVAGALDKLWAEYQQAGKPFLGDFVNAETAGINVIDHCSGNMIVPADLFTHAGLLLIADEIAFDVAAASQIVPQMCKSELIMHRWKAPPFENWEQVKQRIFDVKPKAVLFHANKSGELIELLRTKRKEGDATCTNVSVQITPKTPLPVEHISNAVPKFNPDSTADIFIKTHPPDYPWLEYCLQSVGRFAQGFSEVVLLYPTGHEPHEKRMVFALAPDGTTAGEGISIEYVPVAEHGEDGYLSQQVFKLYADEFTDADFILFMDSDCIFTRPATPETYFTDGLPKWMITPYAKTDTPWQPMIEKFLGRPVEFETMRRHPQCVPRWLLQSMREFCQKQHGMPLDKYVMSQPYREFSEFNALGAFAFYFHHDKFNWINTEEVPADQWPQLTVLQKYSHGGLDDATKAEFETILGPASEFLSPAPNGTAETLTQARLESVRAALDIPPAPPQDQLWVKMDAAGNHVGTFEFDGKEWIPAKWPRDTSNYQVFFSVADAPRFEIIDGQYQRVNPAYRNQTPWADKESSLAEIGRLSSRLKEFCTQPSRVRAVRLALHEAGVIQLPYRFKKRGKWRKKKKP